MQPDPGIATVLHGWNDEQPGEKVEHHIVVGDAYIRNVPTDIRSWGGAFEPNGNSIFIFEVAGLCIGHLGHLHHELTDAHFTPLAELRPELVLFGSGAALRFPRPAWVRRLIEAGIGVETMDTGAACRTYNILAGEGRRVVAALLVEPGKLETDRLE